ADDGVYSFEIATELPYFLPTLENKPEYFVTVGDVELFICLRMIRAFRGPGYPLTRGTSYVLVHRRGLRRLSERPEYKDLHPIPIKTFISSRFTGNGKNAEEVIQGNFLAWRDNLIHAS